MQGIGPSAYSYERQKEYSFLYDSPIGTLRLTGNENVLIGLSLSERLSLPLVPDKNIVAETCLWLDMYFSGKEPDFMPPLSPQGTPFQLKVWKELLTIPYGKTITYGTLATRIGCRSAQAIGQAVSRNPIEIIIPCHRVVGSKSLGGYAYGIECKQTLLQIEHCI